MGDPADPEAPLFVPDCVVDVHIEMDVGDWEALRAQARSVLDAFAGDCLAAPPADVFTWFPSRVEVGGVSVAEAAVRKREWLGALGEAGPSLELDFGGLVPGQTLRGVGGMILEDLGRDPSLVATCLTYDLMGAMGVPAPRCGFARVWVNGADLGVYAHVEAVEGPLLRRLFGDDAGDLYEGARSDFRDAFRGTWRKRSPHPDDGWGDLDAVVTALEGPDEALLAALEPLVDLDAFYTFWAAEVLTAHWDGYTGNQDHFYLYADPGVGGRFRFIPWGAQTALQAPPEGLGAPTLLRSVYANGALARRLYELPAGRAAYLARLKALLVDVWDEDAILAELDRMEGLLLPELPPGARPALSQAIEGRRSWARVHAETIRMELEAAPAGAPSWPFDPPSPPCWSERGAVSGAFDTVWGNVGAVWPAGGQGTLTATIDGIPYAVANVSADGRIGTSEETAGEALVELIGKDAEGAWVVLWLIGPPAQLSPNTSHPLDWAPWRGWLARTTSLDLDAFELLGLLGGGQVSFQAASTVSGEPLVGTFQATLYAP